MSMEAIHDGQAHLPATGIQTAQPIASKLSAALELSKAKWLISVNAPGNDKRSTHIVDGGDSAALLELLVRLRTTAERRVGGPVQVVVIQEAGLDGFWIHRLLKQNGIESHVVDAASIAVSRRHCRAKTDTINGAALLRTDAGRSRIRLRPVAELTLIVCTWIPC